MIDKEKIITRLQIISSYYSFGRILGYLKFREYGSPLEHQKRSLLPDSERLISTELAFLAGMWICNVDISKNWPVEDDYLYIEEVCILIGDLHQCYKPTLESPFHEQLKEITFYEGDPGYFWQFLDFAPKKYDNELFRIYLLENHHYDVDFLRSTFEKIENQMSKQIHERIAKKQKRHEYFSYINAHTISPKVVQRIFNESEQNIIRSLSIRLGKKQEKTITDISDRNIFVQYPIIELPHNKGYFIVEPLTLSMAMNETPFYWIMDSKLFNKKIVGSIRGTTAENIVYNIACKKFTEKQIFKNVLIRKTKSSNTITDIDILVISKNIYLVFQVKSKRLTELSRQGDWEAINKDFNEAVFNAYNQGCLCVNCLKNAQHYYSLKKKNIETNDKTVFINICVTLDQYPTISSISLYKSFEIEKCDIPLLAMSIYDLDLIFELLSDDEILDYFKFRSDCAQSKIYGITEVYYLGAYIHYCIYGQWHADNSYKIPREYAIFIDYIVETARSRKIQVKSINDIVVLLSKFPPRPMISE